MKSVNATAAVADNDDSEKGIRRRKMKGIIIHPNQSIYLANCARHTCKLNNERTV